MCSFTGDIEMDLKLKYAAYIFMYMDIWSKIITKMQFIHAQKSYIILNQNSHYPFHKKM